MSTASASAWRTLESQFRNWGKVIRQCFFFSEFSPKLYVAMRRKPKLSGDFDFSHLFWLDQLLLEINLSDLTSIFQRTLLTSLVSAIALFNGHATLFLPIYLKQCLDLPHLPFFVLLLIFSNFQINPHSLASAWIHWAYNRAECFVEA